MARPVNAERVEAWLEAVHAALPSVILSADHILKPGNASSRRNLGAGRGVNGIRVATAGLGGK